MIMVKVRRTNYELSTILYGLIDREPSILLSSDEYIIIYKYKSMKLNRMYHPIDRNIIY